MSQPIYNANGQVAIKWVLKRPAKTVKIDGAERVYVFVPRTNVWMAWVEPEDVERMLSYKEKTCNCANGRYKQAFDYANELDVCLWETGNRC